VPFYTNLQLFIDIRHKNKDNNDDSIQFVVPVWIQNRYNRGAAAHASARGQLAIKRRFQR
jgi:hypothetical protein